MLESPQVGFEPTASRLTADCSTPELLRIFIFTIETLYTCTECVMDLNKMIINSIQFT